LFETGKPGETGRRRKKMKGAAMKPARKEEMEPHCAKTDAVVASLLLDPAMASDKARTHIAECDRCRQNLDELRGAMGLLDSWKGPEPSPFFLPRLAARIREERRAEEAGWLTGGLARLRARMAFGPLRHARPLAAMALTVLLLVGGGVYFGISAWERATATPGQAAVVRDLQTMENNAQLLDQMEALSSNGNGNNQSGD
jgi:hypothetical protein